MYFPIIFFRSASEITVPSETTHLNLSSNNLISTDGISGLPDLEFLDLSFNKFEQIKDSSFKDLPKLKVVNLSNNVHLRIVDDYSFFSLPKLEFVTLRNSASLAWISYRAFYDSYNVKELDLSFTNITALQAEFKKISSALVLTKISVFEQKNLILK